MRKKLGFEYKISPPRSRMAVLLISTLAKKSSPFWKANPPKEVVVHTLVVNPDLALHGTKLVGFEPKLKDFVDDNLCWSIHRTPIPAPTDVESS